MQLEDVKERRTSTTLAHADDLGAQQMELVNFSQENATPNEV